MVSGKAVQVLPRLCDDDKAPILKVNVPFGSKGVVQQCNNSCRFLIGLIRYFSTKAEIPPLPLFLVLDMGSTIQGNSAEKVSFSFIYEGIEYEGIETGVPCDTELPFLIKEQW